MRTTIDIPGYLMKKAKIKAVEEGISLKELFTRSIEKELADEPSKVSPAPWKQLYGKGSAAELNAEESGFDDPADRLIAATALLAGSPLATHDKRIRESDVCEIWSL